MREGVSAMAKFGKKSYLMILKTELNRKQIKSRRDITK